jgi:hypothetical protein
MPLSMLNRIVGLTVPFIYFFLLSIKARKKRNHWEDQDVGGWTILKWILER